MLLCFSRGKNRKSKKFTTGYLNQVVMQKFISCDWGTSVLRLKVIDADKISVLAEVESDQGISGTFDLWKQSGNKEEKRLSFYQSILAEQIRKLEGQLNTSLLHTPILISGMASSNIGMIELPYKEAPFSMDGHDLFVKWIEEKDDFRHKMLVVSGVKTADDAVRGEEAQLIGCLDKDDKKEGLFIFPGTHSKHILVKNGEAVSIKTYMTGEFFDLLSKKSILSNNVEETNDVLNNDNIKSFEQGIAHSVQSNILHGSFVVRTNHLFGKLSRQENFCYLSGLLIGTELNGLADTGIPVTIVGNELLIKLYGMALQKLGVSHIRYQDAGKAVIKGHCKIYRLYKPGFNEQHTIIKQ
jgi:2-dehydro-3-deoxygalactonokinase